MKDVMVIAPHPDDETLGCSGVLLRHKSQGDRLHWLIVTAMNTALGYSQEAIDRRSKEIQQIAQFYSFDSVHQADLPAACLDTLPMSKLIDQIGSIFKKVQTLSWSSPRWRT